MLLSLRLLAALLLGSTAFARADVLYNLTLTSTEGYAGGTGSFTLNTPPPATGVVTYVPFYTPTSPSGPGTPGDYLLTFNAGISVQGRNILMTLDYFQEAGFFPDIQFTDGVPSNFYAFSIYVGERSYYQFGVGVSSYGYLSSTSVGPGPPTILIDEGTVTITPAAVAATPEPSSLALVGTGLFGVASVLTRRLHLPSLRR